LSTYLVTGAAGFVGSKLAASLISKGHEVVTVDNLSTGHLNNLPVASIFLKGDCQDQQLIDRLYQWKFDAVFHIAGQSSGEVSYDDPVYDLQTNTQSTLQLLKLCIDTGCTKFIYASSMSVYGQIDESIMPVSEASVAPRPESFYGAGKHASEHYLRLFTKQYGIGTASLRLFNVYGPGQNLENLRQGMVSIFLAQALKTGSIHVKGSADRYRDFVYIDDVVNAFMKCEQVISPKDNFVLNICTGKKTTVGEVIHLLKEDSTAVKYKGSTPGDQFGIFGNPEKAGEVIKWKPVMSFSEGMRRMISWAKKTL
jgi:UDP-glucose 4-epimerase